MKHQINHLLLAIILFAGITTSVTKADEIEGTWSQEGQYKKFSKEYTDLKLFEVSADGTKIAIVADSTLRIFDIQSGLIQTKLTIPNISDYPHQPYCISKDFKYLAITYMNMDIFVEYQEYYRIFNTMILDITTQDTLCWVTNTTSSELLSSSSIFPKPQYMFFTNDNILNTLFSVTLKDSNSKEYSQAFIYDCPKQTIVNKIDLNVGFTSIFKTKVASKYVAYDNYFHTQDLTGSDQYQYYHGKVLYCKFDTSLIRLAGEWWSHRSDEPAPPHAGFCPTPLGITGDDKMLMTHSGGEYIFYDLDSLGKTHRIDTAYYPYPVLAVLFPNSKNNKSFLTIHNADLASVKISERSYFDGLPLASYEIYGNHFRNYGNIFRLIDSSRIVICEAAPSSRKIYILDLNLKTDSPELDITSDIQSGTTNDTVKFSIKCPATHRDIIVDYGDGTSDTEYPYHHVYSKPGTYSVQINALNQDKVYEAFRRKDYISIRQGLELSFDVFHYCMPDNIQMKVINTSTENHENQTITIAQVSDLDNSREIKGKDTLIAYFTEYDKYKFSITAFDNNKNIICRKDSIIDITPTSSPNISSEIYYKINLLNNLNTFGNYNTVDFLSYESPVYGSNTNFSLATINDNDQLTFNTKLYCYFGYYCIDKIAPTKYSIDGTIYDFATGTEEKNLLDFQYYNLQYFNYNDSLYGQITKPNQITVYSSSTHQVVKTLTNKILNINWGSWILPFTSKYGMIYLLNQDKTEKINCYILNSKTDSIKMLSFDFSNIHNGIPLLFKNRNICQYNDDILLAMYNKIFRLNLSNSEVDSLTIGEDRIEGLCAIKDNMIAVITRNKEKETVINLVDNSFTKFKTITLPKREDVIQYCNITPDNQLRIIYSTKYGDLYLCRVPILDIASSSVAESKSEKEPLVFPNPAANTISIEYPLAAKASIKIVDETGQVFSANINSANADNFSIDTSLLPDGIYFVQIQDGEINKSVKFVISR